MLITLIEEKISSALKAAFSQELESSQGTLKAEIALCQNAKFGHYQCNNAFALAKLLKMPPRKVAEKIIQHLNPEDKKLFSKIELAGAGFINLTLDSSYLSEHLNQKILSDALLGADFFKADKQKKIIVEFSSPNVAKELHVGHLRSTIIGDSLAKLFEFLKQDVLRLNHIGDWGTQFGMLIAYLEDEKFTAFKTTDLTELTNLYKAAKKKFDEDAAFKKRAQLAVVALQSKEAKSFKIWQEICQISRRAYEEIYRLLGVKINERGESFYNPVLPEIVQDLEKKGLVEVSDGAKCIFQEGFKSRDGGLLPLMVQKSDGGYTYDTTDMAGMRQRARDEKADRIIVVTDSGQSTHFKMIYGASLKAGYIDPKKCEFNHVPFGLVLGPDGKKFKTRSGETEKLIDLLDGAVKRAQALLEERGSELPEDEKTKLAEILGINAIKYADLSCNRVKDYQFSYDRMLQFEGNTASFLLYSYVRVMGIKRKIEGDLEKLLKEAKIVLEHPSEIALGFHLARFAEVLFELQKDLLPHRLCDYLYELAEKFNGFFRDCKVAGSKEQNQRLVLCDLTAKVLEQGFAILGLKTALRM